MAGVNKARNSLRQCVENAVEEYRRQYQRVGDREYVQLLKCGDRAAREYVVAWWLYASEACLRGQSAIWMFKVSRDMLPTLEDYVAILKALVATMVPRARP